MDVRNVYKHSGVVKMSPDGRYVAAAVTYKIAIRRSGDDPSFDDTLPHNNNNTSNNNNNHINTDNNNNNTNNHLNHHQFVNNISSSSNHISQDPVSSTSPSSTSYRRHHRQYRSSEEMIQLYSCVDTIADVSWSSDSAYVLCHIPRRHIVQVWSVYDPEWTCKIEEGPAGIANAVFAPDSRHILTFAAFSLRISIWSLIDRSVQYIPFPKCATRAFAFSHPSLASKSKSKLNASSSSSSSSCYLALAQRHDCQDTVKIFNAFGSSWQMIQSFRTNTFDLYDLKWSPDGNYLCVWDTHLKYKIIVYSLDGRELFSYCAYENALGIKSVEWSPDGRLLAVGSFDEVLRIFNTSTWRLVAEFDHPQQLSNPFKNNQHSKNSHTDRSANSSHQSCKILKEVEYMSKRPWEQAAGRYVIAQESMVQIRTKKPEYTKQNPKIGIGIIRWSNDSQYLVSRNDNMPHVLWIRDMSTLQLKNVIVQLNPVLNAKWDPVHQRLAFASGCSRVYLWSKGTVAFAEVDSVGFAVRNLHWNPSGNSLVATDRNTFAICRIDWE